MINSCFCNVDRIRVLEIEIVLDIIEILIFLFNSDINTTI